MKKILIGIILISSQIICSQSNQLFSPNKTKWMSKMGFWTPIIGGGIIEHTTFDHVLIKGDTIVNNLIFQKLYKGSNLQLFDTACTVFHKYILNDSNYIYLGNSPDSMELVFNFNLVKGDSCAIKGSYTVPGSSSITSKIYYPKVDSVSTVLYFGKWRKKLRFEMLPYNTRITWIEGIGDINYGFLESYQGIMTYNIFGTSLSNMFCFYDGGINSAFGSCAFTSCTVTSVNQPFDSPKLDIFPNPVINVLHISNKVQMFQNSKIEIINYLGQSVLMQNYSNSVDVSGLSPGLYTLKIVTVDKEAFYSKFVKE